MAVAAAFVLSCGAAVIAAEVPPELAVERLISKTLDAIPEPPVVVPEKVTEVTLIVLEPLPVRVQISDGVAAVVMELADAL